MCGIRRQEYADFVGERAWRLSVPFWSDEAVGRGVYLEWSTRPAAATAPPRSVNPEPMDKSSQNRRAPTAPPFPSPTEVESETLGAPCNPVLNKGRIKEKL